MKTLVATAEPEDQLTWQDCLDWINWQPGQQDRFLGRLLGYNERIGQAWFNSLHPKDAEKLRGTMYDPFYKDEKSDVILALAYLLEN